MKLILFLFAAVFLEVAQAQVGDCAKQALLKDEEAVRSDVVLKTLLIDSMDQGEWSSHKNGASGKAVVYGVPIEGSYESANSFAQRLKRHLTSSSNSRRITSTVTSQLSERGLEAYRICVLASSQQSLVLWAGRSGSTEVTVRGMWRPTQSEHSNFNEMLVEVSPGQKANWDRTPVSNRTFSIRIERPQNDDVTAIVKLVFSDGQGGATTQSEEITIPAYEDLQVKTEERTRTSRTYSLRPASDATGFEVPVSEQIADGWELVPDSAIVNWTLIQGNGVVPDSVLREGSHTIGGTLRITHPRAHSAEAADAQVVWKERRITIYRDGKLVS